MFKKIDQYLLNNFPSAWVTRFHIFIPIGIAIFLLIYGVNVAIPWDPKSSLPRSESAIVITIIPVLVYLVYWFIFQSRYNVIKSKGRTNLFSEYGNYFLYMLLFFTASIILFAVPLSNYQKVKNSVNPVELKADRDALDLGYSLVTNNSLHIEDGVYTFYRYDFVNYYNYYDYGYRESNMESEIKVDRKNAIKIIKNFTTAYNKYTHYAIYQSPEDILDDKINSAAGGSDYYEEEYYNDGLYLDDEWEVQWKLSELCSRQESGNWFEEFAEPWFWKILLVFVAFMALLVHIFKNTQLRQFIFGFISICLTPLLFLIVGVIIFEILRIGDRDAEDFIPFLFLVWYVLAATFSIMGYVKGKRSNLGYISTIYLHFFIPFLPIVLFFLLFDSRDFYWDGEDAANLLYYSSWVVGLGSIAVFRKVYKKYYHIPSAK